LDSWPGTLVVVSHDRYFIERVCDDVYALPGDGALRHLPGGVEQYLQLRATEAPRPPSPPRRSGRPGAQRQAARRELARIERELKRAERRAAGLQIAMSAAATDAVALHELSGQQMTLSAERDELESRWLELSEELEDA